MLYEVITGALSVPSGRADRRRGAAGRQRSPQGLGARTDRHPPPQDGHGVPELRPAAPSDGAGERRFSPESVITSYSIHYTKLYEVLQTVLQQYMDLTTLWRVKL